MLARTAADIEEAARQIGASTGREVHWLACDITTAEGRAAALRACPDPDILVNNAGGPPRGDFREWSRDTWINALDANMLTPIELMRSTIDAMIARKWGRIVNITSAAVKAPVEILGLSNGARSGLTGLRRRAARSVARHGVTINNLLPGNFTTDRMRGTMRIRADASGRDFDTLMSEAREAVPSRRFGEVAEFGAVCAFLCSVQAGFVVGQNVLVDGGSYLGTF